MNTAERVTNMIAEWSTQGLTKADLTVKIAEAELGWPYVWGAVGAQCTPAKRDYYANRTSCPDDEKKLIRSNCPVLSGKQSTCNGCKYYPDGKCVLIDDCQGFVKQVMSRVGISFKGGGCTSMWNNADNWKQKGSIKEMPNCVCCVFYNKGSKMEHIGIHIGNGNIIHCSGTVKRGNTGEKIWTHYAIPKGMEGDVPVPTPGTDKPTLRKGDKGEYVTLLQTKLLQLGYDLSPYGADGSFGKKTQEAVKEFQTDRGLKADGIVGANTWSALDSTEPSVLYTVSVPHLTYYKAEALLNQLRGQYSGISMIKE